jgi:hypothetical protein
MSGASAVLVPTKAGKTMDGYCVTFDPTAGATALPVVFHVPGMILRVFEIELIAMGAVAWSGGTLTRLQLRSGKAGAYSVIAEVPVGAFNGTVVKIADASINWTRATGDSGGVGGIHSTGHIEVVGLDAAGNAASSAAGCKVLVKVTAFYEGRSS